MNENQYGVLLENILDKVNAIADGQRNIERNLNNFRDETGQRLDKVENRLDKVEVRLNKVENRMDSMEKEIKAVKTYVIGLMMQLISMKKEYRVLKRMLFKIHIIAGGM